MVSCDYWGESAGDYWHALGILQKGASGYKSIPSGDGLCEVVDR